MKSDLGNGFQERESLGTTGTSLAEPHTRKHTHTHTHTFMHRRTNTAECILAANLVHFGAGVLSVRSGLACEALWPRILLLWHCVCVCVCVHVCVCVAKPRMWLVSLKCLRDGSFRPPSAVSCMSVSSSTHVCV